MPLLRLTNVHSPESPGDCVSFLRCRLRSTNHLHYLGDLSFEFCSCSWHTLMRLLAESISSFVGRTHERFFRRFIKQSKPLNRLLPLFRPLFSVLICAAMYNYLDPRHIYSFIGNSETSGPFRRAHIWCLLPIPISAGCHERTRTVACSIDRSMRLISARLHSTLSTALLGLAALLL